jgi:DNA-binding FadR family transcriptional regulator
VLDWRRHGGLGLLLDLAQEAELPPGLGIARATMEMRACIGADAARRCAERADAGTRAAVRAHAAALAAERDLHRRTPHYDALWDAVVDGSQNVAYRLALTTLVAGQRVLELDAGVVGEELRDAPAVERLAAVIADGAAAEAQAIARVLLERSIPEPD